MQNAKCILKKIKNSNFFVKAAVQIFLTISRKNTLEISIHPVKIIQKDFGVM